LGGRGRPKVTADVTAALAAAGLSVKSAHVCVQARGVGSGGSGGGGGLSGSGDAPHTRPPVAREVHRFTIAAPGPGTWADDDGVRRAVYDCVREALTGTPKGTGGGGGEECGGGGEARCACPPPPLPPSAASLAAQPLLGVRAAPLPPTGRPPVHPASRQAAAADAAPAPDDGGLSATRALLQEWGRWGR
jgi:hypothetical protein